jgi:hypothetical protein
MTSRSFWGGPPTKESLSNLTNESLGIEICNLLGSDYSCDKSIFKLSASNPPGNEEVYKYFLQFVLLSLHKVKDNDQPLVSYTVDDLSDAELEQFNKKKEQYSAYSDINNIRTSINGIRSRLGLKPSTEKSSLLKFNELQEYNSNTIREHMKDKDYDDLSADSFLTIFRQRIKEMNDCYQLPQTSDLKTKVEVSYLRVELEREKIILASIEKKVAEQKFGTEKDKSEFIMEELKKMASYIMWGSKFIECYYNENGTLKTETELSVYVDSMLEKLARAKLTDPNCVKKLMTFLPLSIFFAVHQETRERVSKIDNLTDTIKLDFDFDTKKLKDFYISNGIHHDYETGIESELPNRILRGPQVQYRLALADELFGESYRIYSEIRGLFNVFGLDVDLFHSCGKYVTYNIYLNLLLLYMQLLKTNSVFPVTLSLKKTTEWGILDIKTQSYEFRYRPPVRALGLFNDGTKFLGIHFFKYQPETATFPKKPYVLPLFVFKHETHQRLSLLPNTHNDIIKFNPIFFSQYFGNASEILTCDSKLYFVEDGEITPTMSITYHELTNMLYYGAKAYIIGDDRTELYFTMLPNDNHELQKLVRLLKMTRVFVVKGKVQGFQRERFKVMTKEEVDIELAKKPQQWRLMGKQIIDVASPLLGGYKKSNKKTKKNKTNKSNKKIKTIKTQKIIKLNQTNKTKKHVKNIKRTKKDKKN